MKLIWLFKNDRKWFAINIYQIAKLDDLKQTIELSNGTVITLPSVDDWDAFMRKLRKITEKEVAV